MITDSHQHFFTRVQYEKTFISFGSPDYLHPLLRDFSPQDLEPLLHKNSVNQTILIQIEQTIEHNHQILALAENYAWIAGVVGWVDLKSPNLNHTLDSLLPNSKLKGIRHPLQLEHDPNWVLDPNILNGLRTIALNNLVFDLLIDKSHWAVIPLLARAVPELTLIIEHFGKPDIKSGSVEDWKRAMKAAARYPNVYCKLSGIMVLLPVKKWSSWQSAELQPYFDNLFEIFGEDRLMFASDWPVSTLTGSYEQVLEGTLGCLKQFSPKASRKILDENARMIYRL